MALTEKEREAQKRYYDKNKPIQLKAVYKTSEEKPDGLRLQAYLAQTGQSANSYIKALIKADLDAKNIPYPDLDPIEEP